MNLDTLSGKATVVQVCKTFDVSRQAYYAARKKTNEPSIKSDKPRKPPTRSYVAVEVLRPAIQRIVKDHAAWGVRKVWATLRREKLCVSQRRVWALMKDMGLTLKPDRVREEDPPRGHVVVPEANRRIATDLTTVHTKQDGTVAVVPVIDCGCRTVLALEVTKSQASIPVLTPVRAALEKVFGTPDQVPDGLELRSDHGPQYTGADCDVFCKEWHLFHTFAPVGRPTGNSVVERFIRTMKEEVVWLRDWNSLAELQQALDQWLVIYNESRPHQALDWQTPAERRAQLLAA